MICAGCRQDKPAESFRDIYRSYPKCAVCRAVELAFSRRLPSYVSGPNFRVVDPGLARSIAFVINQLKEPDHAANR